jgi:hypothetical protein
MAILVLFALAPRDQSCVAVILRGCHLIVSRAPAAKIAQLHERLWVIGNAVLAPAWLVVHSRTPSHFRR